MNNIPHKYNPRKYDRVRRSAIRRAVVPSPDAKKSQGGLRTKVNPIGELTTARAKRVLNMPGADDTSLRTAAMHIMKVTCQKGITMRDKQKAMAVLEKLKKKALSAK